MPIDAKDITAVERLNATFAEALNAGATSAISDLVSAQAVVLPPAQSLFKGPRLWDALRGLSIRYEGMKFMTTDLLPLGGDVMLEVGTFSARPRKAGDERVFFKYQFVWQRSDDSWKLASMVWNRPAPAQQQRQARPAAATQEM